MITLRWAMLIAFLLIAGLAVMICSANYAVEQARKLPKNHYGDLRWAEPEELG